MNTALDRPRCIDLDDLACRTQELPTLPAVVLELLQATGDATLNLDELAAKIRHDQVMTARVLRLANSSFYGMTGQISLVSEAITILGLRAVRSVALSARLMCAFPSQAHRHHVAFWRHTMGTALCARALAHRFDLDEDEAFTAGLLHDLGRLCLMSCFPGPYEAVMDYQQEHDCYPLHAERAVLGVDHQQAGEVLARCWHFSASMTHVMSKHHVVSTSELPVTMDLVALIHLADNVAHALGLSGDPDESVPPLDLHVWMATQITPQDAQALFVCVERELALLTDALAT